jgi:protein-S-isoprenylcysteine O-methyltransferase Ste14
VSKSLDVPSLAMTAVMGTHMPPTAAADMALVLFAIFAVLGFGWRSWLQYRRTGSTGFRGVSAGGWLERVAGVGFFVALAVAVSAPILQETKAVEPVRVLNEVCIQTVGIVVATLGIAATVYAQLEMGDSWRIGVDPKETTTLVRTGVFGRIRNPIYTAMFTFGIGIALVTPNIVALAGFILLVATIELQVRRVEEPHLLRTHGAAYRAYAAGVGRFVPGIGILR